MTTKIGPWSSLGYSDTNQTYLFRTEITENPDEDKVKALIPTDISGFTIDLDTYEYLEDEEWEGRVIGDFAQVQSVTMVLEITSGGEKPALSTIILDLIVTIIGLIDWLLEMMCTLISENADIIEIILLFLPIFPIFYLLFFHIFKVL